MLKYITMKRTVSLDETELPTQVPTRRAPNGKDALNTSAEGAAYPIEADNPTYGLKKSFRRYHFMQVFMLGILTTQLTLVAGVRWCICGKRMTSSSESSSSERRKSTIDRLMGQWNDDPAKLSSHDRAHIHVAIEMERNGDQYYRRRSKYRSDNESNYDLESVATVKRRYRAKHSHSEARRGFESPYSAAPALSSSARAYQCPPNREEKHVRRNIHRAQTKKEDERRANRSCWEIFTECVCGRS